MKNTLVSLLYISIIFLLNSTDATAGPIYPTRGFLINPKWDTNTVGQTIFDTTSTFDHGGYWAQVQRGIGSDSDRWATSITMGAIFEIARWGGNKSLFGFSGMELNADTHDAISFRPRGAVWHEGLVYAVNEGESADKSSSFNWQLGTIYSCRHDIDNGDPGQYSDVGGQRTLIYCSLAGKAIWTSKMLLGMPIPTTAWLHADAFLIGEDYRLPEHFNHFGTDFQAVAWSIGPSFQSKLATWARSALYIQVSTNFTAFGNDTGFVSKYSKINKITFDNHTELGYEFHGRAGRIQVYAGWEQWEDDGQTPIPLNTKYALVGIRVTGEDMVKF